MRPKCRTIPGARSFRELHLGLHALVASCVVLAAPSTLVSSSKGASYGELDGKPEYEARAAFLILLSKYTQWPERNPSEGENEFVIGVVGEDPFGAALGVFEGSHLKGRKVVVRRFRDPARLGSCQVLYFPVQEERQFPGLKEKLMAWNTLAIGESPQFLGMGGGIRLYTEGGYLRFDVNLGALDQARVRVEAKVLRLARKVN